MNGEEHDALNNVKCQARIVTKILDRLAWALVCSDVCDYWLSEDTVTDTEGESARVTSYSDFCLSHSSPKETKPS